MLAVGLKFIRGYTSIVPLEVSKYQGYEAQKHRGTALKAEVVPGLQNVKRKCMIAIVYLITKEHNVKREKA